MTTTTHEASVASASVTDEVDLAPAAHFSLSRAVNARKHEYVRPHRIRIKVGTWNVAACPGTDKDLASWFVEGRGLEPQLDSNLTRLHLSEDSVETNHEEEESKQNHPDRAEVDTTAGDRPSNSSEDKSIHSEEQENPSNEGVQESKRHMPDGEEIGLYVLGLQEIVSLNLVQQSFYSDPSTIAKWQDALEAALPKGYTLVASCQLVGLLLLIYASPDVAPTISNESTVSTGTGVLGYMGNKGAVATRLVLGETTRLVFSNCHLASGHDQASLERRCWDYNKIITQTKFAPIEYGGVEEEDGDKIGDEDFIVVFGDLNFRLDGLPGDDIKRLLMLHTRGEYDLNRRPSKTLLGEDGVIVMRNGSDDDGSKSPSLVSRGTSFDDDNDEELPDPDDFLPDPSDDPASLQATLDSLLPHDQLNRVMRDRKAFHEGWREGPITFLPTYKYDVGTVGLFDSSEKMRAPSWCDRVLFRTRKDLERYRRKCQDEAEAKKKDEEMKQRGIDRAAEDENVLFDYDPNADSSVENLASGEAAYDYDEYDDTADDVNHVTTQDGSIDKITLDLYTSHQRIMPSDHKPVVALFTLDYDAVVPELKAKVHAEVARELDRAENEGRPAVTIVVEGKDSTGAHNDENITTSGNGVDFGEVGYLRGYQRSLTIANTGGVSAQLSFVEKPGFEDSNAAEQYNWLHRTFVRSPNGGDQQDDPEEELLGDDITLDPGETVNAIINIHVHDLAHVRALNEGSTQLEDVLVLRVADGRDHFITVHATWQPTCFGRSLEELIRIPRGGGIRALVKQRDSEGKGGAIPYSLDVHYSSPGELYKLTEAVERLAERVIADENMLGPEECGVPRDTPGWPFDEQSWASIGAERSKGVNRNHEHEKHREKVIDALEVDKPILEALGADVLTLTRLETAAEVLLLFLRGMPDGIITAPLWARIEQALPNLGTISALSGRGTEAAEEARSAVLDILAASPYHNISFVFLTAMLSKVASELLPLGKAELDALNARGGAKPRGGGLGFRRRTGSSDTGAGAGGGKVDEVAIQKRIAWERKAAEIFGRAVCRSGGDAGVGSGGAAATKDKERKALEEKMRGLIEVFMRRDGA